MKLSDSEEQQFAKIYARLKLKNNGQFTQKYCESLMVNRGQIPEEIAHKVLFFSSEIERHSFYFSVLKKVWTSVSHKEILSQNRFYKLLKYVAGLQNGLSFTAINPEEISIFSLQFTYKNLKKKVNSFLFFRKNPLKKLQSKKQPK